MKAYISVPYDLFPYYLLFEAEDTGENYRVCMGLSFRYDKVIKRYSEKDWLKLEEETANLVKEKRMVDEKFNSRAKELIS